LGRARAEEQPPEDQPQEAEYLTPGQAARLLHVSPKTVDRWANQGLVPCLVTLGGHRRFSAQAIRELAEDMAARGEVASQD
jgi:excisionase family DNA binding protein